MNKRPIWLDLIIDTIIGGILLCVFCYFHHVRILWNIGSYGEESETPSIVITKPAWISESDEYSVDQTDNSSHTPSSNEDSEETDPQGEANTEKLPSQSDISNDGKEYDLSGQFGSKFGNMFLAKGEDIVSNGSQYINNDVRIDFYEREETIQNETIKYYYYDIYIRNIENIYANYNIKRRDYFENLLTLDSDRIPIAAISGDYCGNSNSAKEVIKNGIEERASEYVNFDVAILYWDGTFETIEAADYDREAILQKAPYQLWNFGPGLLAENGEAIEEFPETYLSKPHPRSVIGYYEPGHYCFVTVDGRYDEYNEGISFSALSALMSKLGCKAAYNLDGGASAYSYFNGTIIRYSDEKKQNDIRKIYDIICIG